MRLVVLAILASIHVAACAGPASLSGRDRASPAQQKTAADYQEDGIESPRLAWQPMVDDDRPREGASAGRLPEGEARDRASDCEHALEKDVDARTALQEGVAAAESGRWGEAIEHLAAALCVAPTWATLHVEMANALLAVGGDLREVERHIEMAHIGQPENARLFFLEGVLMEELGRTTPAAIAYARAVEIRPSFVDARLRLGRVLLDQGRSREAIGHLEVAVRLEPTLLPARAHLATAYENVGRVDDAARELEAMATLFPENHFHLQRLAALYERHGRTAEARAAMRRAGEAAGPSQDQRRMRPLPPSRR